MTMRKMAYGLATTLTLTASLAGCGGGGRVLGTCSQDGKTYQVGATFKDSDGCNICECRTDGVSCTAIGCLTDGGLPQTDAPVAPDMGPDSTAARTCTYNGKPYPSGATFPSTDGCNTCECLWYYEVACTLKACPGDAGIGVDALPAGDATADSCFYNGKTYPLDVYFPAADGCNACHCASDGQVTCTFTADCGRDAGPLPIDAPVDRGLAPDADRSDAIPADLGGRDTTPSQPVDSAGAIDGAGQSTVRDPTKVQSVSLTAAPSFIQPTPPFLLRADLARGADGLFDLAANLQVSVSGCTGDACTRQVTMRLSREQTARIEEWVAVIPGEACHDDPGPICDFGARYAIGIDGPPQNQTCCKVNEWGQNINVLNLHSYLQDLAVAQINPAQGNPG